MPPAFLKAARILSHLFQDVAFDGNRLQTLIQQRCQGLDFVNMTQRQNFVETWTARAEQLRAAEIKSHKSLHPVVEKDVREKQFVVLLEMQQAWFSRNIKSSCR